MLKKRVILYLFSKYELLQYQYKDLYKSKLGKNIFQYTYCSITINLILTITHFKNKCFYPLQTKVSSTYLLTIIIYLFHISIITSTSYAINDIGTLGGPLSKGRAISGDGSTIVGISETALGTIHAFKYNVLLGIRDINRPDSTYSMANAISFTGNVTVGYFKKDLISYAFKHTNATGMLQLTQIGISSNATAVSGDGLVTVGFMLERQNSNITCPFLHTNAQGLLRLPTFGGQHSEANAISFDGTTIVGFSQKVDGTYGAFKYTRSTAQLHDLGSFGGRASEAVGVSHDGSVIIGNSECNNGIMHAFKYTDATGIVNLGTLGGFSSKAIAISGTGITTVGCSLTASLNMHAFKHTDANGMVDLGTLGGNTSTALAVSYDGSIIAGNSDTFMGDTHGFVYIANLGMIDIGTLGGRNSFIYTSGLSSDGRVATGYSNTANGEEHAFIYRVPLVPQIPPSTPSSFAPTSIPTYKSMPTHQQHTLIDIQNTTQSLAIDSQKLSNFTENNHANITQGLNSECTNFGPYGICIQAGGRYVSTKNDKTAQFIGGLTLAYNLFSCVDLGITLDQNIKSHSQNYKLKKPIPLTTFYISLHQDKKYNVGFKLKLSGGYEKGHAHITRTILPYTEKGKGKARLKNIGYAVQLSYGVMMSDRWNIQPTIGFSYTSNIRGKYDELPTIDFPITYNKAKLTQSVLKSLVTLEGKLTNTLTTSLLGGITYSLHQKYKGFSGKIPYLGKFNYDKQKLKKTMFTTGISITYTLPYNQNLNFQISYGQSIFKNINNLITALNYSIGF